MEFYLDPIFNLLPKTPRPSRNIKSVIILWAPALMHKLHVDVVRGLTKTNCRQSPPTMCWGWVKICSHQGLPGLDASSQCVAQALARHWKIFHMLHKSTGSPGNDIYLLKNSNAIEIVLRSPYNEASRAPPGHAGPSKDGLGTVDVT